jgi:hypothetical protein
VYVGCENDGFIQSHVKIQSGYTFFGALSRRNVSTGEALVSWKHHLRIQRPKELKARRTSAFASSSIVAPHTHTHTPHRTRSISPGRDRLGARVGGCAGGCEGGCGCGCGCGWWVYRTLAELIAERTRMTPNTQQTHTHTYINTHTHTNTNTHIHTHTHTHIHTHTFILTAYRSARSERRGVGTQGLPRRLFLWGGRGGGAFRGGGFQVWNEKQRECKWTQTRWEWKRE